MTRVEETSLYHSACFNSLLRVVQSYSPHIPHEEMLALTAQLVGNLTVIQEPSLDTKSTIEKNIELGRKQMLTTAKKLAT